MTAYLKSFFTMAAIGVTIAACAATPPAATPGAPGRTSPGTSSGAEPSTGQSSVTLPPLPGGLPTAAPDAPGSAIDSCALLSDADLMAGTGQPVVSRMASTLTRVFPSVCDIELEVGSLTVSVMSVGGRSMYETSFEPFIGQDSFLDRAIEGLGDKAGISGDDDLMVLSGDVLFDLFYLGSGRSDTEAVLRYLAEIILAKLPCIAAGCPGYTPPAPLPTPEIFDACTLLTGAEIEATVGIKALDPEPLGFGDPGCTWRLDVEPFTGLEYVELRVKETGGREEFDFVANDLYETPPEHVPGLGDDAVKTGTTPGGFVYALKGDTLVTARFSLPFSVDDPYPLITPLVETALSRLD